MKQVIKKLTICIALSMVLVRGSASADNSYVLSDKINLTAECSVLIEANSRRILYMPQTQCQNVQWQVQLK